jgi:DNA repair exonuclease SbcCD ATPase subunit
MEGLHLFLMLFLVVGFAAGAGAVWLVLQGRTNSAYARARAEMESSHAEVIEALRGKEEQVQALQSAIDQGVTAMDALKAEAVVAADRQTAAETEKTALAARLEERDQRLVALESELSVAQAAPPVQAEAAAPPPPLPPSAAPALDEKILQVLARPIEEHLADIRVRLEQLSAAPRPEPALNEEALRSLARPIEEKIAELSERVEAFGAARPEAVAPGEMIEGLARPIGEQLAGMRQRMEELGSAARPEPGVDAETLRNVARPIEDQLSGMQRRLEQMEANHLQSAAVAAGLHARNAELQQRLNSLTRGMCELRGALARSLDLCSLAVATAETATEPASEPEAPAPAEEPVVDQAVIEESTVEESVEESVEEPAVEEPAAEELAAEEIAAPPEPEPLVAEAEPVPEMVDEAEAQAPQTVSENDPTVCNVPALVD